MSISGVHPFYNKRQTRERNVIQSYLAGLRDAYHKKFFQNSGNSTALSRVEAQRHLESVYNRLKSSPNKIRTLVDYEEDMIEGLDPFQVHDFICKKELEEIEISEFKPKGLGKKDFNKRAGHLITSNFTKPTIEPLELKQSQLLNLKKRVEQPQKNSNQPQMRAYTVSHKKGRQITKSKDVCFLNQSLVSNLDDRSISPIKFIGQSVNTSGIHFEERSGSPSQNNNESIIHTQNLPMKLQIKNPTSNNLLMSVKKQNIRYDQGKNRSLNENSKPHPAQSVMSINSSVLNPILKPFESDLIGLEKEDTIFNPEFEEVKEKHEDRTDTKPVILQNHSEALRTKLEEVVLKDYMIKKKPSTTLLNKIDAKLKRNKALNGSNRSISVLTKNYKNHENSSPNQLKPSINTSAQIKNVKESLPAADVVKQDVFSCYPKIRSQQETAKFSENHLRAYNLFSTDAKSAANSSSTGPDIKKVSEFFEASPIEGRQSILKKKNFANKQEDLLITSQGDLRTGGSITFDKNVRYQEFPRISPAPDQVVVPNNAKRNSTFFKEGKSQSQLSTDTKTWESQEVKISFKSIEKMNSHVIAESIKNKAQSHQTFIYPTQHIRYMSLDDDSPGGMDQNRNSLNFSSINMFKNRNKVGANLQVERTKCQSIINRSMDLSDDIHEIGDDLDKVITTQGQRHEKVGDLLDILQKASYAHSGILQTVYHYNKTQKLENKNEEAKMIRDYSEKREKEFVQKEIEEGKALKARVRKALRRNAGRAGKI